MQLENSAETRYVDLCDHVIRKALKIAAVCANGRTEKAGLLAADLAETVNASKHSLLMQQEQTSAGRFDLAGLTIDTANKREE